MSGDGFALRSLSLGAGVQSTALYMMAEHGRVGPKPDVAIFADTQQEPQWVYDNLALLAERGSIPIEITTSGDIGEAVDASLKPGRFASVPFWVKGSDGSEAPGRRQCTREFKIDAVKRKVRELLGYKKGQRVAKGVRVEEWVGISIDEAQRAKPSRYPYVTTRWPLIEEMMRRRECEEFLSSIDYPIPQKSACIFCPYRKAIEYDRWRKTDPELFEQACQWDEKIRAGGRGLNGEQFILRQLVPLRDVAKVAGTDDDQLDLFNNECEGMCGV